jgi:Protein of unknown function (DUF2490)
VRLFRLLTPLLAVILISSASVARAETTVQLWMNMMVEWQTTPKWFLACDLEPKRLLYGEGQWLNLDLTTTTEYAPTRWLDLIAELVTGYTDDTENPDAWEVTPRLGLRAYLWRSRFQLRDTFRAEQRNRFFDDDTNDHLFRLRNRVEARYVLNRQRTTEAGAWIAIADYEYFIPIDGSVHERYASRHRVRAGIGYRWSVDWRVDLLYFYQRSRDTNEDAFDNTDNIIDIRIRRAY